MKIITLSLGLAFFILAFMIIGGSLNFINSNTAQAEKTTNTDCVEISYDVYGISYISESKILSFWIKQRNEFSNGQIPGINIRLDGNTQEIPVMFDNALSNGMTKKINVTNITMIGDLFFVSPLGCTSAYEKRCYISKGSCS